LFFSEVALLFLQGFFCDYYLIVQEILLLLKTGQTLHSENKTVKLFATVGGEVSDAPVNADAVLAEKENFKFRIKNAEFGILMEN
jgi:hypothetical protein